MSQDMIEADQFMGGLCFPSETQLDDREAKYLERIVPVYESNIEILEKIEDLRGAGKKVPKSLKKNKYPSFKIPGHPYGNFIGFNGKKQPFRHEKEFPNDGSHLFFLMDTRFHKMHTSQCLSGIPTTRGHVISDMSQEAENLIIAYGMAHSLSGNVPQRYNQFDMWLPELDNDSRARLFEMSSVLTLAVNSCMECEVPVNHPEVGGARVFVTNPLSLNPGTYWSSHIYPVVRNTKCKEAADLLKCIESIYKNWGKYIQDNPRKKSKSNLAVNNFNKNKTLLDGWGLFQIEKEIKAQKIEGKLFDLIEEKRTLVGLLKNEVSRYLVEDIDYWNI